MIPGADGVFIALGESGTKKEKRVNGMEKNRKGSAGSPGGEISRLKRTLIHRGTAVSLYADTMCLPDGSYAEWDFIAHPGGACAVAVREDGRILLVSQYRDSLGDVSLELPGGARSSAAEPDEETAARELEEETGYRAKRVRKLLDYRPDPSLTDERVGICFAEGLTEVGQRLDPGENIRVVELTLPEALGAIRSGKITDGKTVCGILAYAADAAFPISGSQTDAACGMITISQD